MYIQLLGWQDNLNGFRKQIVADTISIMHRFFKNDILLQNDLTIYNINSVVCPYADDQPCTHFDRSRVCLNVDGAFWCQFVHQLSHELCHCSTARQQLPQRIKWFDEFICCCSSYLVEAIIAQEPTQKYDYMFWERTKEVFSDYWKAEQNGHIYHVDNTQEFFEKNKDLYQRDENLIKKHDIYVRSFFEFLKGDFSGLSFVGKMYLVQTENNMDIEKYLKQLLTICNDKEISAIYQICKLFGIQLVRQMKDSGIAWVGKIPQHWQCLQFRALFTENKQKNIFGKETKALQFNYGTIVPKKDFDTNEEYVAKTILNYNIVDKGMIILNGLNLNFDFVTKRIALVREKGVITSAYMSFYSTDINVVMPEFANYLLKSYDDCAAFHNMGGGVRKILNFNELKKQYFILPTIKEQRIIVNFLNRKCEKIDGLKADIQAQIDSLEQYKRSVITEAVTHGLNMYAPMKDSGITWIGQIPSSWTIGRIGGLYELRTQKVSDKEYIPLSVTMKGILPQLDTVAKTNDGDNRKLVKKGDFAINSRSDRRGSCGISNYDGSVSLINTILKPRSVMNANYYNWLFHTPIFADEFFKWGHGIVDDLWTTNWQDMKRITIPVPPLQEQKTIANYLDQKCAEIEQIIADKKAQLEILNEYKKSLIYEYVTGKQLTYEEKL